MKLLANKLLEHICCSCMDTVPVSTLNLTLKLLLLTSICKHSIWLVSGKENMPIEVPLEIQKIKMVLEE